MVHKNKYPALALMFLAGQTLTAEAASPAGSGTNDFPARREMVVAHAYLHLPVSAKGKDRRMRISVDGKIVRDFAIAFSEDRPDFYAACETEIWKGKKIVLELEHPSNASALDCGV
ncbi:MAG: hypothetical protein JNM63_17235 [Spirochaetia bacterium]|nr:hypothetical protein [Spirochaetia bacterium]